MSNKEQVPQDETWKLRYSAEFELDSWLGMEPPPHMTVSDWMLAVCELDVFLTDSELGKREPDALIRGWKLKHGLL